MSWIKLYDKIKGWEFYNNTPIFSLWLHILIEANWEDREWGGISIPRGSLVTSVKKLCEITGMTSAQIRGALVKLTNSKQISIKTTNKFTIITICNYGSYQTETRAVKQTNNKQLHTNTATLIDNREEYIDNKSLSVKSEGLTPRERELIFDIFFYKFGTRAAEELERFTDHYQSQGWTKNKGTRVTNKVILSKSWESKSDNKGDIPEQLLRCLKLVNRRLGVETTPLTKIMAVKVTDDELYISARESDGVFQFIEDNAKVIGCAIRKAYKQKIIYDYRK